MPSLDPSAGIPSPSGPPATATALSPLEPSEVSAQISGDFAASPAVPPACDEDFQESAAGAVSGQPDIKEAAAAGDEAMEIGDDVRDEFCGDNSPVPGTVTQSVKE